MPHTKPLAVRPPQRSKSWLSPVPLAGIAAVELMAAAGLLLVRAAAAQPATIFAPAAMVIAIGALVQLRLILIGHRAGRLNRAGNPLGQVAYWRSLFAGATVAYLAALTLGPLPHLGSAWLAAVCVWQTVLLLPLAASPSVMENWRRWTQKHTARRLSWLVVAASLLLVVGEVGLRVERVAFDRRPSSTATWDQATMIPTAQPAERPLAVRVARLKTARFRVALLGAETVSQQHDYHRRVEKSVPGVDVALVSGPVAGPVADHRALGETVETCEADLVLAVLPVCQNLAHAAPRRDNFDWRQLELVVRLLGEPPLAEPQMIAARTGDFESFLRTLRPQLAACRTPLDAAMTDRWDGVFASLDALIESCRDAQVPLAVMVVPAEFQVDRGLCDTLLRRNGLSAETFDVELPQRRLARFAATRQLQLIDLLPHLRLCRQSVYQPGTAVLNEQGNTAVASAIGGWLQSRYGGQLAAQLSSTP